MRKIRRTVAIALCGVLAIGMLVMSGSTREAQAAEFYPVPASGVYTIDGRGYGHGHGMSQWGAQGAAQSGLDASQILDFYYPGTNRQSIGNPALRVKVWTPAGTLRVDATAGQPMTVKDLATGKTKTGPATAYRVVTAGNGQRVDVYSSSRWTEFALAAPGSNFAGPISFSTPDGVTVFSANQSTARNYRGSVQVVRTAADRSTAVNHVTMEDYLKGVVPRESPASFRPAALQAQAVAARSYAWYDVAVASGGAWDLCDTTACQVYAGRKELKNGSWTSVEQKSTNDAIGVTAGLAVYYNGSPAFTQFSASNGGSASAGSKPYLKSFADPYDGIPSGNTHHDWTASLSADALQKSYPQLGTLSGIRVLSRSGVGEWGGYITSMELVGNKATVAVSARLGLKSTYWRPREVSSPFGDLNSATVSGGTVRLTGWTIDPDTSASTQVHVYVGSQWGGAATASVSRPDVAAVYPDKGAAHGFDISVKAGPGIHQICVYGINLGAGTSNSRIGCASVDMGKAPIGRLDQAVLSAGQLRLVGWAVDPDTADPVDVHVYVNGRYVRALTASVGRPDVGRAYPASGSRHGFDTTVALTPGTNKVCVFGLDIPTRTGNPQLGCATVTSGAPPVGDLNSATVSGSNVRLVGWTLDPDTPNSIPVHVYVDGRIAKVATAAVPRADIGRAYPAHGSRHGYDVTVGLTPGRHSVCVYAIDAVGGQKNPLLRCARVTVGGAAVATGQLPVGNIDSATVNGRTVTLVGWALDRDLPTRSIGVHVYVDGRYTRALTASVRRGDIAAAFPNAGSAHGWSTALMMAPGNHRVCAYGINVGGGSSNPLLRCVDVRVP
jgi:SpoIID/LytB domain protein